MNAVTVLSTNYSARQTMEETNKDPNFMAQADTEKKLEEKFRAANQKLEEIQKVSRAWCFIRQRASAS